MCEGCYKEGSDGCLECREPNVLLEGVCVAIDTKTGVCDGRNSKLTSGSNAGWVYDNDKKVCDGECPVVFRRFGQARADLGSYHSSALQMLERRHQFVLEWLDEESVDLFGLPTGDLPRERAVYRRMSRGDDRFFRRHELSR